MSISDVQWVRINSIQLNLSNFSARIIDQRLLDLVGPIGTCVLQLILFTWNNFIRIPHQFY